MCLPPTMVTGGLIGHTMAKANESREESRTVNNYYGNQTKEVDPIVEANKTSAQSTKTNQSSQKDRAY